MFTDPSPVPSIPTETYQAARKVYNIQNIYLRIGDRLDDVRAGVDPCLLDPSTDRDGETAFRLAMATAFQYAEDLPDPLAAEATRKRLDWKYALYLPITSPGIDSAALCRFRRDLAPSSTGLEQFAILLGNLRKHSLFTRLSNHSLDPRSALAAVCVTTRLYRLSLAMKSALGLLVAQAPDWVRANALPHWYEHYRDTKSLRPEVDNPQAEARRIGADMQHLTSTLRKNGPAGLADQPEILLLSTLLQEQFLSVGGTLCLRPEGCWGCACHHLHGVHSYS